VPTPPTLAAEDGMTIIEVMVAMVVLLVGVLGVLVMIQGSVASTSQTKAREQGTNLVRDLVERARQVSYSTMTAAGAPAALAAALPEAPAATAGAFTVTRRNIAYTATVSACSIDDPQDGAGVGDASFCDAPGGAGPGSPGGTKVLGYNVAWNGDPITALCTVVTSNGVIGNLVSGVTGNLLGLAQGGAQVSSCAGNPTTSVAYDAAPDDLRRVRISLAWNDGHARSLTQTTLLAAPR
jgi:type IV pilus assembly protein PilV